MNGFEHASSQLLKALRGARSQVAFARRLGYRANPISDWENGRRFPTARETLRAAARVGVDVVEAMARFHPAERLRLRDGVFELAPWLDVLRGSTTIVDLSKRTGKSRFSISRVLKGESQARLPDFLALVDAITGRVPELVAELVPIEEVPAFSARYAAARAARTIAFEEPWTEAVLRVLETESYRCGPHEEGRIAKQLGLSTPEEARALKRLAAAGLVRKHEGRFVPEGQLSVETRAAPSAMRALHHHWARVSAERLQQAPCEKDIFAYNVCSLRADDLDRVREIYRAAYRELRSLVAASDPPETVALATFGLVTWPAP